MLEKVDLTRAISKEEYKSRLPALQERLYDMQLAASEAGQASLIVFEGWDAAGKGTCINVLTSRLEPRAFRLHVIQERVEKIAPPDEWEQAYHDITDFERTLADDGYVLVKLFLHIGKKEQKHRFRKAESDPLTSWQVQPGDWKRHRKYGKYLKASEEMLERTESEWAPWTIVEATDRYWTRIAVFEAIIGALEVAA